MPGDDMDNGNDARTRRLKRKALEERNKLVTKKNKSTPVPQESESPDVGTKGTRRRQRRAKGTATSAQPKPKDGGEKSRRRNPATKVSAMNRAVSKSPNKKSITGNAVHRAQRLKTIMLENEVDETTAAQIDALIFRSSPSKKGNDDGADDDERLSAVNSSGNRGENKSLRSGRQVVTGQAGASDIGNRAADGDDEDEEEESIDDDDESEELDDGEDDDNLDKAEGLNNYYGDVEDSDAEHDLSVTLQAKEVEQTEETDTMVLAEHGNKDPANETPNTLDVDTLRPGEAVLRQGAVGVPIPRRGKTGRQDPSIYSACSTFDQSVVVHMLESLKKSVSSNVKDAVQEIVLTVRKDLDEIAKLKDYVEYLTNIVSGSASAMFIKQPAASPRMKEIHNKICTLPTIFKESVLLRVLTRCILGSVYQEDSLNLSINKVQFSGVQLFSTLFFTRQPGERAKEKFSSYIGRIHSKLRNGVMISSFMVMQTNKFGTFQTDQRKKTSSEQENDQQFRLTAQPFWLKPGYVRTDHCLAAAMKFEKNACNDSDDTVSTEESVGTEPNDNGSSGKTKTSRTGPITRDEIATEASCIVYKLITSVLHRARFNSRIELFQSVLYIFSGWAHHKAPVSQSTLVLKWEEETYPPASFIDNLPSTKIMQSSERLRSNAIDVQQVDVDNLKLLEAVILDHPELSLMVEHDVLVEGAVRRLKYRISMVEVACKFFASFISGEMHAKAKDALSTDKSVLKVIMVLAFGLRALMEKAIQDMKCENAVPWEHNIETVKKKQRGRPRKTDANTTVDTTSPDTYVFEEVNGLSIDILQPSPSKKRDLLTMMILKLSEEEFLCRSQMSVKMPGGEQDSLKPADAAIQPDDSLGVYEI